MAKKQYSICLKNIKNISYLKFDYPTRSGVYLITGANGSGKSSLLVAMDRICNQGAFKDSYKPTPYYAYEDAEVTYTAGDESVTYTHKNKNWVPIPKKGKIFDKFPFTASKMLTTYGTRFFSQPKSITRKCLRDADSTLKESMNKIFRTNKFSNLKFEEIRGPKGPTKVTVRTRKLYLIVEGKKRYDENCFSLGERLVLNTLDFLTDVKANSQILIDEIELALHPFAQVKFLEILSDMAKKNNLYVFLSTHSATLIKKFNNLYHLNSLGDGKVEILTDVYPAFVLQDIGIDENYRPDKIFFVEDKMARYYLKECVDTIIRESDKHLSFEVLPIGGFREVVQFLQNYRQVDPDVNRTYAMLDADVKQTLTDLKKIDPHNPVVALFAAESKHYDYLEITPEIGLWEWIETHKNDFKKALAAATKKNLGCWDAVGVIDKISTTYGSGKNPRENAKKRIEKLIEELQIRISDLTENDFRMRITQIYVAHKFNDKVWVEKIKAKIMPFLHASGR